MIYKQTFTIVVLSEYELDGNIGLADIDYLITDGDCIGEVALESCVPVPDSEVENELVAIGNDGTFFATDDLS